MGWFVFVRGAVAVEELCVFELVMILGVGVFAFYRVKEEACDYFTVVGEVADVSLQVVGDAHVSFEFPVLSYRLNGHKRHKGHRMGRKNSFPSP